MKKISLIIVALFVVLVSFFSWMEYKSYQIRQVLNTSLSKNMSNTEEVGKITEKPEQMRIDKNIWDIIKLSTVELKVEKSEEKDILTSKYYKPRTAKADTKFIVIDLNVKNIIKEPFTDFFNDIYLEDSQWKKYLPANSIGSIDDYIAWRNFQPGIEEKWKLLYEIPRDSFSYYFTVWKWWTNEIYYIKLK